LDVVGVLGGVCLGRLASWGAWFLGVFGDLGIVGLGLRWRLGCRRFQLSLASWAASVLGVVGVLLTSVCASWAASFLGVFGVFVVLGDFGELVVFGSLWFGVLGASVLVALGVFGGVDLGLFGVLEDIGLGNLERRRC
jgi:hypothetical protein